MKKNARWIEMLRFVITGGVCFLVEFIALVLLRDKAGIDTLIATPIAFLISVVLNYLLCIKWVFTGDKDEGNAAKIGFLVTSVMGLFLNEGLMYLFRVLFGEDQTVLTVLGFAVSMYMVNKALATLIVMVWNYLTKRAVLKNGWFRKK
ncbi:MAG: GtrA family protein [Clostridia bacterium]|nr:GtrA family protein [Clostridia bacterium]